MRKTETNWTSSEEAGRWQLPRRDSGTIFEEIAESAVQRVCRAADVGLWGRPSSFSDFFNLFLDTYGKYYDIFGNLWDINDNVEW